MFLSYAIHFRKILVKSQPQRSYKKVLIKKVYFVDLLLTRCERNWCTGKGQSRAVEMTSS